MTDADSDVRRQRADELYRRMRWQLPILFGFVIAALAALAIQTKTWSWPLFGWGVVVGLVGAAFTETALRGLSRRPEVTAADRERVKARRPIYLLTWVAGGAVMGGVAAIFGRGLVDVLGAAYSALCILAGLAFFAVGSRRGRTSGGQAR